MYALEKAIKNVLRKHDDTIDWANPLVADRARVIAGYILGRLTEWRIKAFGGGDLGKAKMITRRILDNIEDLSQAIKPLGHDYVCECRRVIQEALDDSLGVPPETTANGDDSATNRTHDGNSQSPPN